MADPLSLPSHFLVGLGWQPRAARGKLSHALQIHVCYKLVEEYLACVGYHRVYLLRQFRHLLLKILHPG
jgi:hypothetical protein